jgi:hypothetical protein
VQRHDRDRQFPRGPRDADGYFPAIGVRDVQSL